MSLRIVGDTNIDFLGKRRAAYVGAILVVLLGLVAVGILMTGGGNLSIQFVGGSQVEGHFAQAVDISEIREALSSAGLGDAEIVHLQGRRQEHSFLIRFKAEQMETTQRAQHVLAALAQFFPDNVFTREYVHDVGPAVGATLKQDTFKAIAISLIGILIYVAIRFDLRFGLTATLATFHDVMAVMAFTYLIGMQIDILVVSAILTVAGYSLTDKVVVYDRIRENLRKFQRKSDFLPGVNRSINEVLSRTIMTGMATLSVLVVMLFFAGPVLFDFSLVLLTGILVGTYSSCFVAAPIYVDWENRRPKRFKA